MSRFRQEKARLAVLCAQAGWMQALEGALRSVAAARAALNPLLSLLNRPELRFQAAYGLGLAVPRMAQDNMESARVVMRRLMWSLNEESGNLGWGAPLAMGCILAGSTALAREYARIFISYGYETGTDDNFIDHAPLRREIYWGVGQLAGSNPAAALPALPHLAAALADADAGVRAMAAWALARLAEHAPAGAAAAPGREAWQPALEAVEAALAKEEAGPGGPAVTLFDGRALADHAPAALYAEARAALQARLADSR